MFAIYPPESPPVQNAHISITNVLTKTPKNMPETNSILSPIDWLVTRSNKVTNNLVSTVWDKFRI